MNFFSKVSIAALALISLFSTANAQEKKITRKQLPPAVEKIVAQQESEGATAKGFATEVEKGQKLYEAEFIVNGHHKDILMNRQGVIVEAEEEVSIDSLPATVQDALKKAAGSGTIKMIESLTKGGKLVAYEGHVKTGKKRSEIQVGPNGEKLKRPE